MMNVNVSVEHTVYSGSHVSDKNEDLLGRAPLAKLQATVICTFLEWESFAVRLFGKLGSDKTSLIALALAVIRRDCGYGAPIPICFELWNCTTSSKLLIQFFKIVAYGLKVKDEGNTVRRVRKTSQRYADSTELIGVISSAGMIAGVSGQVAGGAVAQPAGRDRSEEDNLVLLKGKIGRTLLKSRGRVLVLIDGTDRLITDQIRMVFQLVNSVVKFPNVTYLLAFDREVLSRALTEVQNCDGVEYLEKIIQFSITLPEARISQANTAFFESLDGIVKATPSHFLDRRQRNMISSSCAEPRICSMRDVKRFLNAFSLLYGNLCDEGDFADLVTATVLQTWEPRLYGWMVVNRAILNSMANGLHVCSAGNSARIPNEALRAAIWETVGEEREGYSIDVLKALFPQVRWLFDNCVSRETTDEFCARGRIADSRCFDLVVSHFGDVPSPSKGMLVDLAENWETDEAVGYLHLCNRNGTLSDAISVASELTGEVAPAHCPDLLEIALRALGKSHESMHGVLGVGVDTRLVHITETFLRRLGAASASQAFLDAFPKLDLDNLMGFAELLNSSDFDQGRYGEGEKPEGQRTITADALESLQGAFVGRVRRDYARRNLLERANTGLCMEVWGKLDEEKYEKYTRRCLWSPDRAVAMHVTRHAGLSTYLDGQNELRWSFCGQRDGYVTPGEAVAAIERFARQDGLWGLPAQEQEKIATCYLVVTGRGEDCSAPPMQVQVPPADWGGERDRTRDPENFSGERR